MLGVRIVMTLLSYLASQAGKRSASKFFATAFSARIQNTLHSQRLLSRPASVRTFALGATVEEDLDAALDSILGESLATKTKEAHIPGSHPMPEKLIAQVSSLPQHKAQPS